MKGKWTVDRKQWTKRLLGPMLILLAAAVATAPLLLNGFSCGHDFDFHLVSWMDARDAWQNGTFYPHWTPSANFGAGEPRFLFYPPLTWILGAALGAVLGWQAAPVAMAFLLLAGTGLAVRVLAKQMLPQGAATLAGCIAIFSGYALYCVYERSAYGEMVGGCTIPLALLFAMRQKRSTLWLALTIAASWLANAPVGVMVCYLLAAFVIVLAIMRRSWAPVLRAAVAVSLGLGLAAFYLVPAAVEQRWVDIQEAINDPGLQVQNSFIFAHHASAALKDHDIELFKTSLVATTMFAMFSTGFLICLLRKRMPGESNIWLPLALIPLAVLFLQLPLSLPVWNLLPKLSFLQFPWRWLVVLEAPLAIFLASSKWPQTQRGRITLVCISAAAFVGVAWFAGTRFQQVCDDEDSVAGMTQAYEQGQGSIGTDEYAPQGADNTLVAQKLPVACLVSDATATLGEGDADDPQPVWRAGQASCDPFPVIATGGEEHRRVRGMASHAGYVVLRLRRYPAWNVRVNDAPVTDQGNRDDGLMVVPVQPGFVDVTMDWTTTSDVKLGRWISLVALLTAAGVLFAERKK
ncbi:6-pyruvoyl-tetrahydropterin synthase-related protein [Terracidiphilus gabretensis]|uniref:6-pyruvoyl-tetrahydropterin synthase-related protein n=1 Tax=Terracidiphilus gabretensis TaxID=1577687 RepID=UPI00071B2C15|nr:6-pyruvoyl-tetrahydropterin synthase-related protein [Terracidiphilus gabretensis]